MDEIIVAIIALIGTILGSAFGVIVESNLIKYRLTELEKKVDKHNNLIERMYRLEERVTVLENEEN